MERNATAVWNGTGKEGTGHLTTQSNFLSKAPYSFDSRFNDATGTNPEELVAAAHAGGFTATDLETTCTVTLEDGAITSSHLTLKATIPTINKEQFDAAVADAKANCPISKLYNTTITCEALLM